MFDTAANAIAYCVNAATGVPITYRRGAATVSLTATVGQSTMQVDYGNGFSEEVETRDYLNINAADLVLSGAQTLPQAGDKIVESQTGIDIIYELMQVPGGAPYRFSDTAKTLLRIHTNRVAS